jgi:hypothetical protein
MNSKTTLALVVLAGLAGVWVWKGDAWGPRVGIGPDHPEPPKSDALRLLDGLTPAAISRVEVAQPSGDPLVIERAPTDTGWKLPGNWPARKPEVEELVETLGTLRTRFHPIELPEGADLKQFGLASEQKPVVVKLTASGQVVTLSFGEPKRSAGDSAFTHPAYVRVNDAREVFKLGPDVMPVVRRPADSYRRRQLFPDVERVKLAGAAPASPFGPPGGDDAVTVTLPGEDTVSVRVARTAPKVFNLDLSPAVSFTLVRTGKLPEPAIFTRGGEAAVQLDRLADAWALESPARDRVDPARARTVLAAVTDLWVDEFVTPAPAEDKLGFADFNRSVTVRRKGSEPVTVRFGAVAKTGEREETIALPSPPGAPPSRPITRKVPVDFRYARVDGNPQVFLVNAEKLSDLFAAGQLADPQVARFSTDEVREVVIRPAGKPEVKLARKKGDPKAKQFEDTQDRWFLDAKPNPILADARRVEELLGELSGFRASGSEHTQYPAEPPAAETRVTLVLREPRPEGEPDAPAREITLLVGKPDPIKRRVPVSLAGWPRVTLADDTLGPDDPDSWIVSILFPNTVSALINRPPLAYRNRKLFDSAAELSAVSVAGGFSLARVGEWKLTAPITSDADPGAAAKLAFSLAGLSATDYLTDAPTPDELKEYGLEKPAHTVTLGFRGGQTYTLELGAARPGKAEVFARLDKGAVFGLSNAVVEQLTTGVVGLLPLKVWATEPEKVTSLAVTRPDAGAESYQLAKDGTNWKLTGPFAAPVPFLNAQPLLATLGNLTAVKYQTLTATNPAEFGLDKPLLTLKIGYTEKKPGAAEETPAARTVTVGGLAPDGLNRYARLDEPNAPVFVVPAAWVAAAQTPPLDLLDRSLLFFDAARIAKVRVAPDKSEDAFTLTKDEKGRWSAEGITFAVDAERMARLTATASRLPVLKLAAYGDAVKWADYGLEKPETTVEVTLGGERTEIHKIALGKPDALGGRYTRVDDGRAVAVIPLAAAEALTRKKFEYADRTLLTFDPATVTALTRRQGKDELELAPGAAVGWDIVKPAKQKADQTFVDELADALGKLRADRVAAYGKKDEVFKQFGLEPPAASITLTVGDKAEQRTLRIGNPVDAAKPDGERYAAVEGANPEAIVGVLSAALSQKLLAPPVAFRDRTLSRFVDADKAVLERGDRTVTFAKVGVTWRVTEPVATAAESAELEALVADLGKLRVDTWVGEKGADLKRFGLDKPQARWTLFDGDKPVVVLLLGTKTADGRVHVATDKSDLVGLLDPVMTNRLLAEYRQRKPWDVDAAQIQSVEIAAGSKFTLEKAGTVWVDAAKPADPIDVRVVNELLGTLGALRAERYAADKDADPKLFGLDKPEVTLTVTAGAARRVLEIGGTVGGTDGKQRYARVVDKDRSDVFVLTPADTTRLTRDRAAYLMKK